MKVLVATNNAAKLERYRKLLRGTSVELLSPHELGIESVDVEETGKTLAENALLKVRAYKGSTGLPILGNDTGIFVVGEGLVTAPKRIALDGVDEKTLTKNEIAERMLAYWKGIAAKNGGAVDAEYLETFALLLPDGTERTADSKREMILTDTEFGIPHESFPLRSLYLSKVTGKPAITHTLEEDDLELAPVLEALLSLLV